MSTTIQNGDASYERIVELTLNHQELETKVENTLKQHAANKQISVPGFRPGAIPLAILKKQPVAKAIHSDVISEMLHETFVELAKEHELEVMGAPEFKPVEGVELKFNVHFDIFPRLELKGLDKLKLTRIKDEPTPADQDVMLEKLQKQKAEPKPVERAAKMGDQLKIDFEGFLDGEAFDGGKAEDFSLELGSKSLIPGFEEGLVGVKASDEKDLELAFPKDYHVDDLKDKKVVFKVKVNSVNEMLLPELNEEFAKAYGCDSIDQLKSRVLENMKREMKNAAEQYLKNQVMDGLLEKNEVEVPAKLVMQEAEVLRDARIEQLKQEYQGASGFDSLPTELFKEEAAKRVKLMVLIDNFRKSNDVTLDDERVKEEVKRIAAMYDEPQGIEKAIMQNEEQMNRIASMTFESQVVDIIAKTAKVEDKILPFEDALKVASGQAISE